LVWWSIRKALDLQSNFMSGRIAISFVDFSVLLFQSDRFRCASAVPQAKASASSAVRPSRRGRKKTAHDSIGNIILSG
jgi:hypothetical protein